MGWFREVSLSYYVNFFQLCLYIDPTTHCNNILWSWINKISAKWVFAPSNGSSLNFQNLSSYLPCGVQKHEYLWLAVIYKHWVKGSILEYLWFASPYRRWVTGSLSNFNLNLAFLGIYSIYCCCVSKQVGWDCNWRK